MEYHPRTDTYELNSHSPPVTDSSPPLLPSPWTPNAEFLSNPASPDPLTGGLINPAYSKPEYKPMRYASQSTAYTRTTSFRGSEYEFGGGGGDPVKRWGKGVHWYMPTSMVAIFISGVLGAFAHHVFYTVLDGKEASNQLMMVRYGTALAFFTKACLVGSVVLAYRQRLWHTLRRKSISLRGIDSLFAIVEDPTWFLLSKELYLKAKLATLMAAATWVIPLASVLSPGSLTAELTPQTLPASTCTVPSLDFSLENTADWRNPRYRIGYDIPFWNTTPPPPQVGIDWYDQPSKIATRLTTLTVLGQEPIGLKTSPCPAFNCTYNIEFWGPWYNCSEQPWSELDGRNMNFTRDDMAPSGTAIFIGAVEDEGIEYLHPQPDYDSDERLDQGHFLGDPSLWFAYVEVGNRTVVRQDRRWNVSLDQYLIRCFHQKAFYNVELNFTNSRQSTRVSVSNGTTLLADKPDGIRPEDEGYKEFVSYYTLGFLARRNLLGKITKENQTEGARTYSDISQTKLINQETSYTVPNFRHNLQKFYEEIVISLLSEPSLEIAINEPVDCVRWHYVNLYRYHRPGLWIGYAICVAVAFGSVIVGGLAIRGNGVSSDTTFSKILVTTRNPAIDEEVAKTGGACLGAEPPEKELEKLELKFGIVGAGGWTAFGRPGEVRSMLRERERQRGWLGGWKLWKKGT